MSMYKRCASYAIRSTGSVSKYFKDDVKPTSITSIVRDTDPHRWKTIAKVLITAISQKDTFLKKTCIQHLLDNLDLSNACSLLELGKMCASPHLYEKSLEICIEAAFIILDSSDFDQVSPATVISIASQPNLNVGDETEIFYSLWMRATLDCCREDHDATFDNISTYFKPYSICVRFKDIDEQKLSLYNNDTILKYYKWRKNITLALDVPMILRKRNLRSPVKLPAQFFSTSRVGNVKSLIQLQEKPYEVKFSVLETVYLVHLAFACDPKQFKLEKFVEYILLKNEDRVIFEGNDTLNLRMEIRKSVANTCAGRKIHLYEFQYNIKEVVKLSPEKTYSLIIAPSSCQIVWPVMTKNSEKCPIIFCSDPVICLIEMKAIRSP